MKNHNKIIAPLVVTVIAIAILISFLTRKTPFEAIKEIREGVLNYDLISTTKTDEGILLYSHGEVNSNTDDMYFVDMVKNSFFGYKWVGGGGHINRNIGEVDEDFIISIQMLNEEQNIKPTLFGIILHEDVVDVRVDIFDGILNKVTIYDGLNENEKFYTVHFENNIADLSHLVVIIAFSDGNEVLISPSPEEMERLQEGKQLYINDRDLSKYRN